MNLTSPCSPPLFAQLILKALLLTFLLSSTLLLAAIGWLRYRMSCDLPSHDTA